MRPMLTSLLFLTLTGPAIAVDGVLEINQTCAVQTGCFAGDTPGFPVTITSEGSYRLTGNLFVLGAGGTTVGIQIATRATLDLGGFEIRAEGATAVTGGPAEVRNGFVVTDTLIGGGLVSLTSESAVRDLRLRGYDAGAGVSAPVSCGDRCLIENIRVDTRETTGIVCGNECVISNVTGSGVNSGYGVFCGDGCVLDRLVLFHVGVQAGSRTQLRNSAIRATAFEDGLSITLGNYSIVEGCTIQVDGQTPLPASCGKGCKIFGNTFSSSGAVEPESMLNVGDGSLIRSNVFRGSAGVAFRATGEVGYSDNVFTNNNGGNANPQVQGGTDLGGNLCGKRTSCP